MMREVVYAEEQLIERLKYWQKKLNLSDWRIKINICRARDMREDCAGSINWTLSNKMASISILDPIDYPTDVMEVQDMENTLVHELLHIHLAPLNDDYSQNEHYTLFEEWAICSIVGALIELERK